MTVPDVVVVGGGFYGLSIALFAREHLGADNVLLVEAEPDLMERASYINQARIHNGYHYPRSILTAYRSRVNSASFAAEFAPAVRDGFSHYYAVARRMSKVNARQFEVFCDRIGAPYSRMNDPSPVFSKAHIDAVWEVQEHAFDARVLRELILARIEGVGGIDIRRGERVARVLPGPGVEMTTGERVHAGWVISAVYSGVNALHTASGLPVVPVQHEITEMALVRMPAGLENVGITVMDGPFFSVMPFPARGLHSLSHVRYTPQTRWREHAASDVRTAQRPPAEQARTAFLEMRLDAQRYVPALSNAEHIDSIRETKTVLLASEHTDSRPILARDDWDIQGYVCVLGGKIDNVGDALQELARIVR